MVGEPEEVQMPDEDMGDAPPPHIPPQPVQTSGAPEPEKDLTLMDKLKALAMPMAIVAIVIVAAAFIVVPMMGGGKFLTKAQFEANLAGITDTANQAVEKVNTALAGVEEKTAAIDSKVNTAIATATSGIDTRIATAVAGKADQATMTTVSTQAANAATTATNAATDVATLKTTVTTQQTTITNLQADITALTARIVALETTSTTPATVSNSIEADITTMGTALLPTSAANTTLSTSFRIDLTNTTNADIEDIVLDIFVETNVPQAQVTSWSLTGGSTVWQSAGYWYGGTIEFMNTQWGLNVKAGETKRLYLTLNVNGNFPVGIYQYQVTCEVLD